MDPTVIVLVAVVVLLVIALAIAGALLARRRRSEHLQEHFGPEYDRLAAERDPDHAEAELAAREKRHHRLDIHPLGAAERDRFGKEWADVQRRFVDDPARSLDDADRLVVDVMRTRGYPVDDFDQRADDISVEHPDVVHHYRQARRVRDAGGRVDTEDQRHALTSYRSLVQALLDDGAGGTRDGQAPEGRPSGKPPRDQPVEDRRPEQARPADHGREDRDKPGLLDRLTGQDPGRDGERVHPGDEERTR